MRTEVDYALLQKDMRTKEILPSHRNARYSI